MRGQREEVEEEAISIYEKAKTKKHESDIRRSFLSHTQTGRGDRKRAIPMVLFNEDEKAQLP